MSGHDGEAQASGQDSSADEIRVGVYVCHCGTNIAKMVDVADVAAHAGDRPGVVMARDYRFMCSDPGQELIQKDIREHGLNRVVVAACSPLMHEATFRKAVEGAGLNRYLFAMSNIREQVSWVTTDRGEATAKAKALVSGAAARVRFQEQLTVRKVAITPRALVVGGGIAGIEAALQMADAGYEVVLVEREPSVGGHMASFDKTFPTLDCAACILTPKMVAVGQHPRIRLMTCAELEAIDGYVGNFKARIRLAPRYVDVDACNSCGTCYEACPSHPYPARRRMRLGDRVYRQGTPRELPAEDRHSQRVSRPGFEEAPSLLPVTEPEHAPVEPLVSAAER